MNDYGIVFNKAKSKKPSSFGAKILTNSKMKVINKNTKQKKLLGCSAAQLFSFLKGGVL